MPRPSLDSLKTRRTLTVTGTPYDYFSLAAAAEQLGDLSRLPHTLKILLENLLRHEDGATVTTADMRALAGRQETGEREIAFRPARVLMQDFTGVPAVVDLAAMRDALVRAGGEARSVNPRIPVDLVIDHSVTVDHYGTADAFARNVAAEMDRNRERYTLLRWAQLAFDHFRVVPPGTGICHQVNLEYLGRTVWSEEQDGRNLAYPDTLVGTDSHTTMINGLAILGWGVGGIEAEAAMLGRPISLLIPEVVGVRLTGAPRPGVTATDLVLTLTEMLRTYGVVDKFVEFFGPGLNRLSLADRATIANMAPEYGATCGFFPIDGITLDYLRLTGRDETTLALVEAYAKAQGLWRAEDGPEPLFSAVLELDLAEVVPSLAGPKRPQDRVPLTALKAATEQAIDPQNLERSVQMAGTEHELRPGDLVIAAITSCTNTSNPAVMLGAGLLAKKAVERGLGVRPWVKTSLAPGSPVVSDYLQRTGLQDFLDRLGFRLVGYGCTTCIGNSGPLDEPVARAIAEGDLAVGAILSGNRNFEGRIHPLTRLNWLASPPLVVAYALAGTTRIDLDREPLGTGNDGKPVFLREIWPSPAEIAELAGRIDAELFRARYADVFHGQESWRRLPVPTGLTYAWDSTSTYVQEPPFFLSPTGGKSGFAGFRDARVLALLGDSITTDHISPAGAIPAQSPAGRYLLGRGVPQEAFNSYGARRGNHQVMLRGTLANIRIRNDMVPGVEGGITRHLPSGEELSIYDAAMRYQAEGTPLLIVAGKEYGTGSSRDWAAKGTLLLGVRAVLAEGFERIHRSNLIGMGVLPLQFRPGENRKTLGLDGSENFSLDGGDQPLRPGQNLTLRINRGDGQTEAISVLCRLDTQIEVAYYQSGGILNDVLRRLGAG